MDFRDPDELAVQVQNVFKRFLEEKNDKYADEALLLLNNERSTLFIDFKDVELFDPNLTEDLISEYYRFYPYICRATALYIREEKIRRSEDQIDPDATVAQRMAEREQIKKDLDKPQIRNKDYYIGFYNFSNRENIRDLSSTRIGTLTRVSGQVVRTHSVHPELIVGCFKCKDCFTEQLTWQQFRYTEPNKCSNENCANRSRFELLLGKSRFSDFQRLRIQETQQELPRGCIPRSFDIVIRGADQVECIQPGDRCDFVGTLIAVPNVGQMMNSSIGTLVKEPESTGGETGLTGLKSMGVRELTYTHAFLASACIIEGQTKPCVNTDESYRENAYELELRACDFTKEEILKIEKMSKDKYLLDNLSQSLFSSVYGSDDIKRGIVLQLLGGVPKITPTGTKLRGDINICLVGDPSTAKSQFLKIVTDFAPVKAVYASGKASSASGLTAAVVKDTDGGFVIEAGALMLADRGICCIDEFDKMDLRDQVAIHEAMEQQTISITKAGVTATLNARASILAAANPVGGTYDTHRNLRSNVNLSVPIMSRFDLFFTLIDSHEQGSDLAIANRILDMHNNFDKPVNNMKNMTYSFDEIRLYLKFARRFYPRIPVDIEKYFVEEYVRLRSESSNSRTSWRITVRQLEAMIRLSEAIARAHCEDLIKPEHVKLAARLIENTIVHVGETSVVLETDSSQLMSGVINSQPNQGYDAEAESQRTEPSQPQVKIDIGTYKSMAEVFRLKLQGESDREDREELFMRRSELIDWYLHRCVDESEINTVDQLVKKKQLCEKVLDRLVRKDFILMEVHDDGKLYDVAEPAAEDEDRFITVNPNLEVDDIFDQINV